MQLIRSYKDIVTSEIQKERERLRRQISETRRDVEELKLPAHQEYVDACFSEDSLIFPPPDEVIKSEGLFEPISEGSVISLMSDVNEETASKKSAAKETVDDDAMSTGTKQFSIEDVPTTLGDFQLDIQDVDEPLPDIMTLEKVSEVEVEKVLEVEVEKLSEEEEKIVIDERVETPDVILEELLDDYAYSMYSMMSSMSSPPDIPMADEMIYMNRNFSTFLQQKQEIEGLDTVEEHSEAITPAEPGEDSTPIETIGTGYEPTVTKSPAPPPTRVVDVSKAATVRGAVMGIAGKKVAVIEPAKEMIIAELIFHGSLGSNEVEVNDHGSFRLRQMEAADGKVSPVPCCGQIKDPTMVCEKPRYILKSEALQPKGEVPSQKPQVWSPEQKEQVQLSILPLFPSREDKIKKGAKISRKKRLDRMHFL